LSKTSVKERRANERRDTKLDVQGTPHPDGAVARMVARNLSLGGVYCSSTTDFPEMTRLAVRLMLPRPNGKTTTEVEPVDLEAVVVRREEVTSSNGKPRFDLALFFTSLDDPSRDRIRCYLDHRVS
jgi:hypothetical protein